MSVPTVVLVEEAVLNSGSERGMAKEWEENFIGLAPDTGCTEGKKD